MDIFNCPHKLSDGSCDLANQLAEKTVIPHESACNFCLTLNPPQSINRVTVSIAINGCNNKEKQKHLINTYGHLLPNTPANTNNIRLKKILEGDGVGSKMWKILSLLGIEHNSACSCLGWAERMNSWGPIGCRLSKKEIVNHMKESAKNYGWGDLTKAATKAIITGLVFKINPLDVYGSLIEEAIRLAELEERKIPLEDGALNK